jgi:hypothetical protein
MYEQGFSRILIARGGFLMTLEMVNRDSCNRFTLNLLSYYHQIVAGVLLHRQFRTRCPVRGLDLNKRIELLEYSKH